MGEFSGKNAIVTGAARGIGNTITKRLISEGANVWYGIRRENQELTAHLDEYAKQHGVWAKPICFDHRDEAEVKTGIKSIIAEKHPVDILVNNAGAAHGGLITMTPLNKLKEIFEVNYFSQILIMQLITRIMMRQKSGVIVNMASIGGIEINEGYLAYGSSKAALIYATKCLAKETSGFGIRVNAVAPGLTETAMGNYKNPEEIEKVVQRTGMKRMADTQEIADAVLYLLSPRASFVTGQILQVDGGRL